MIGVSFRDCELNISSDSLDHVSPQTWPRIVSTSSNDTRRYCCYSLGRALYSFLGHMYAAEAMIQLGRIQEAISHLSPDNISGISSNGSGDQTAG